MGKLIYAMHLDCFKVFNEALAEESDRARVVLVAAWIDRFLEIKIKNEFSKGNAKAREHLLSSNGPFATFSNKLNTAFCAGWIDADVYHDAQVIRKIRNVFAHSIEAISLDEDGIRKLVESLRVPGREYHDWGQIRAAATKDGAVIYTGTRPDGAIGDLHMPGALTFRMAISVIVAVLVANLDIPFTTNELGCITKVKLPEYMCASEQDRATDAGCSGPTPLEGQLSQIPDDQRQRSE